MNLADTILVILDDDPEGKRRAFLALLAGGEPVASCAPRRAIAFELCQSLLNDLAVMPMDACEKLDLPTGATYAHGANRVITSFLHFDG